MPLSSIVGHVHLLDLLRRAVGRDRVPQSLLFAGPEGVGKRATAVALAQAVNCTTRRGAAAGKGGAPGLALDDACGKCVTCLRIARGQHSDVVIVDKGEYASIRIEAIRERVLSVIGYRPFEAARRVYIIDPADEMGDAAQDALLKTLEEPPPAAILILITAYPDTLRPTIQSRCRRLRFGTLAERDVARVLVEHANVDAADARLLAAVSGGSVSHALADEAGDLSDDRERAMAMLGAARGRSIAARLKAAAALAQVPASRRTTEALGTRLAMVASLLRDLAALSAGSDSLANADLAGDLRELHRTFDLARVTASFEVVHRAQTALERNGNPKIVADLVGVSL